VAIHTRIVQPALDITLLFLGLPLVVSRSSRNVFMAIGLCLGVVTIFVVVVIGIEQLGTIELIPPALAAWLPLLIFIPAAVGMAEPMWER
jgi:lipopolysaccharide export system permease protein